LTLQVVTVALVCFVIAAARPSISARWGSAPRAWRGAAARAAPIRACACRGHLRRL